jgi:SAM-dependent methyltransferase
MTQTKAFLEGEADQWYLRNRSHLSPAAGDTARFDEVRWLCEQLSPFRPRIGKILEVGCSSGAKLARMCEWLGAHGSGIDPSQLAIEEGQRTFGELALQVGSAARLPFEAETFDVVHFGFCLYLVDRSELLSAVAEADRVLRPGGFLTVTDFDPAHRHMRPYVHAAGLNSYKQDYARLFADTGLYIAIAKCSYSHTQSYFDEDSDERVASVVLYKERSPYGTPVS